MPAEIAVERVPDGRLLDKLVGRPVVGRRGMARERQPPGGPDVDEVRRYAAAVRRDDPNALKVSGDEINRVRHDKREADKFHRPGQLGVGATLGGNFTEGHRRPASLRNAAKLGRAALKNP